MRTPAARAAIALAALAAVTALFVVLADGGGDGTDAATTEPRSAQSTTAGQSAKPRARAGEAASARAAAPARRRSARAASRIERIVVRGGRPVGGVKRLEYERGERVRFSVRSDVADEVHVHGFDVKKDVPAQGSVRFAFRADIEGVFEVELEHSKVEIAELRIRP